MQTRILPFSKNPDVVVKELEETDSSCGTTTLESISYQEYISAPENYTLLDVRTEKERAIRHIGGLHIPLPELQDRYKELHSHNNLLIYCSSGLRSTKAISKLKDYFTEKEMYNLEGGLKKVKLWSYTTVHFCVVVMIRELRKISEQRKGIPLGQTKYIYDQKTNSERSGARRWKPKSTGKGHKSF